jgi:hypothetical protein
VRFSKAAGDKGPQATSVRPVGKHHVVWATATQGAFAEAMALD